MFVAVLHVSSTNAEAINKELTSYLEEKECNYRKRVGQAYNGAATFAGVKDYSYTQSLNNVPKNQRKYTEINKHLNIHNHNTPQDRLPKADGNVLQKGIIN